MRRRVAPAVRIRAIAARLIAGLSIAACLFANAAFAAETKAFAAPRVAEHAPVSTAGSLAQVTVSLLLVLAAVFAAGWVVRKLRGFGKFQSGAITIIADVSLGMKERAVLVQVGSQQMLLGVAQGQVNALHVWPEGQGPVSADQVALTTSSPTGESAAGGAARPDFKAILKRSLGL